MKFEWSHRKAEANLKKHQVRFEEATTVFDDPLARIFLDEAHSGQEEREIIIGHSNLGRLLLVCFHEYGVEMIRIISARTATRRERKDYEENAGI